VTAGGGIVPPGLVDGWRAAFGPEAVAAAGLGDEIPADVLGWLDGDRLAPWLEADAARDGDLEAHVLALEVDGGTVPIDAGFVTLAGEPVIGSDSPAALRAFARKCRELADMLDAAQVAR
jgi:hypothetical protein